MERDIFDYELKLIEEVSKSKFSFKKVIKLFQLGAMMNHNA